MEESPSGAGKAPSPPSTSTVLEGLGRFHRGTAGISQEYSPCHGSTGSGAFVTWGPRCGVLHRAAGWIAEGRASRNPNVGTGALRGKPTGLGLVSGIRIWVGRRTVCWDGLETE